MATRRLFIKSLASAGASSIFFCNCCNAQDIQRVTLHPEWDKGGRDAANIDSLSHQHPNAGTKRKPFIFQGKKVKVIDTHAHCFFPEAVALAGSGNSVNGAVKGGPEHYIPVSATEVIKRRIENMDAKGVDMEVLSVNTFWYSKDFDLAKEICRINNDNLAELCRAYPTRFAAFGSIATQFPELAVQQLVELMKNPAFKGVAIQANVAGIEHSDPRFHSIWAKAEELGAVLFIHPQSVSQLSQRFKGNGWMSNVIGNPLDTTIALQHLIYEGVFDKFPNLKVLAAHGGGFLGSYGPRMDHSCFVSPSNCDPSIVLKKKPTEYLNQIYFDSLVFTTEALRHLVAQVGSSQIVVGTDSPIPWEEFPVDHVLKTPISDVQKAAILGYNAARLLKIPS